MSKTVKLRKGLDIRLLGEAEKVKIELPLPSSVSVKPADFHGLTPKMVAKVGDQVKAGSVIFMDKYNEQVKFVSPLAGTIQEVVRGEKRKILSVIITVAAEQSFETTSPLNLESASG